MNHFESGKKPDLGIERLRPDLRMQVELALRFYHVQKEALTKEELDSHILKWVEYNNHQYASNFRRNLNKNPELLALYEKEPESALEKMESLIY